MSPSTHTLTHTVFGDPVQAMRASHLFAVLSNPEERRRGKGECKRGEQYAEVAWLASAYHLPPLLHSRCTLATGRERDERGRATVQEREQAVKPTLLVCSVNINCIFCSSTPSSLILLLLSPPPRVFFYSLFSPLE